MFLQNHRKIRLVFSVIFGTVLYVWGWGVAIMGLTSGTVLEPGGRGSSLHYIAKEAHPVGYWFSEAFWLVSLSYVSWVLYRRFWRYKK